VMSHLEWQAFNIGANSQSTCSLCNPMRPRWH
jgi:hypothetical protein